MSSVSPSFFEIVNYTPPDAIFELTKTYNADPVTCKVNLGQGTYKDENGNPWILPAVRLAKEKIKDSNHEYLPILGLPSFRTLAGDLVFGKHSVAIREGRVSNIHLLQTVVPTIDFLGSPRSHPVKLCPVRGHSTSPETCLSRC
jgi:aspartate aminotransferase